MIFEKEKNFSHYMNLEKATKKGFLWFFGKSSAQSKILRKPLMLIVPFIVKYTHKNPTKFQFNPANRFFPRLIEFLKKLKEQTFRSEKFMIFIKN